LYNENWISDRSRYAFDGLKNARLSADKTAWEDFILEIGSRISIQTSGDELIDEDEGINSSSKLSVLIGSLCDLQSIYFIAQFFEQTGKVKYLLILDCGSNWLL
jgi:NADH dehydrogenase/NADH:ubiquinone oxidoreductase subunit G